MDIFCRYATKVLKLVPTKVLDLAHRAFGNMLEERKSPNNVKVVSLKPDGPVRGHVLLSYGIELLLTKPGQTVPYYHYNRQLSASMARTFVSWLSPPLLAQ